MEPVRGGAARVTHGASNLTENVPVSEGSCWATPDAPLQQTLLPEEPEPNHLWPVNGRRQIIDKPKEVGKSWNVFCGPS